MTDHEHASPHGVVPTSITTEVVSDAYVLLTNYKVYVIPALWRAAKAHAHLLESQGKEITAKVLADLYLAEVGSAVRHDRGGGVR